MTLMFWFCNCCCALAFFILRRLEPEWPAWEPGALPIGGDWARVLPAVGGVVEASSIIIIACRRLVPTAGMIGTSAKEAGGLMGVTASGTKLRIDEGESAGKLV